MKTTIFFRFIVKKRTIYTLSRVLVIKNSHTSKVIIAIRKICIEKHLSRSVRKTIIRKDRA